MSSMGTNSKDEEAEVLIIDDEVDICQLLAILLRNHNIKSIYSNTLNDARKILEKKHLKLIFLDNHLPDGTGLDFISYIREISPETKIVMVTAHNNESNRKTAYENGAVHFIGKPFNSDEIYEVITKYLKSSNL